MKDLGLLVFRILLVALFPISAYYKIVQWPAIATVLDKAGAPYATYVAGSARASNWCSRSSSSSVC